jgi:hypothetical protein
MKTSAVLTCAALAGLALTALTVADEKPAAKSGSAAAFDGLKKLVGEWCQADKEGPDGKPTGPVVTTFKLTAAGSVLHETIFPGTGHEMVTAYHLDGPEMVCTHYCALGNQPRLKLEPGKDGKTLNFKSVSLSNGKSLNEMHMGRATITLIDDNHYKAEWTAVKDGQPVPDHVGKFNMARKAK